MQAVIRGHIGRREARGVLIEECQANGQLLPMPGTLEGHSGFYQDGDQVYQFVVTDEGEWNVVDPDEVVTELEWRQARARRAATEAQKAKELVRNVSDEQEAAVQALQTYYRGYSVRRTMHRLRVSVYNESGQLLAMHGTAQGETGFYQDGNVVLHFVVSPEGEWSMVGEPVDEQVWRQQRIRARVNKEREQRQRGVEATAAGTLQLTYRTYRVQAEAAEEQAKAAKAPIARAAAIALMAKQCAETQLVVAERIEEKCNSLMIINTVEPITAEEMLEAPTKVTFLPAEEPEIIPVEPTFKDELEENSSATEHMDIQVDVPVPSEEPETVTQLEEPDTDSAFDITRQRDPSPARARGRSPSAYSLRGRDRSTERNRSPNREQDKSPVRGRQSPTRGVIGERDKSPKRLMEQDAPMFHLQRPALGKYINTPQVPSQPSPIERDPRSQNVFMPQPELAAVLQEAVAQDVLAMPQPVEEHKSESTDVPAAPPNFAAFYPMANQQPRRPKQNRKRKKKAKKQKGRNLVFQNKMVMPKTRQGGQRHLRFISERLQASVMSKASHGYGDGGYPAFSSSGGGFIDGQAVVGGRESPSVFEDDSFIEAAATIQRAVRMKQAGRSEFACVDQFFSELVQDISMLLDGTLAVPRADQVVEIESHPASQAAEDDHELQELEEENRLLRVKLLEKRRQEPTQEENNQVRFQRKLSASRTTAQKKTHLRKKRTERKRRQKLGPLFPQSAPASEKRRSSLLGMHDRKNLYPTAVVPDAIDTTRGRALAHAYGNVRRQPKKYDGYNRRNR